MKCVEHYYSEILQRLVYYHKLKQKQMVNLQQFQNSNLYIVTYSAESATASEIHR